MNFIKKKKKEKEPDVNKTVGRTVKGVHYDQSDRFESTRNIRGRNAKGVNPFENRTNSVLKKKEKIFLSAASAARPKPCLTALRNKTRSLPHSQNFTKERNTLLFIEPLLRVAHADHAGQNISAFYCSSSLLKRNKSL